MKIKSMKSKYVNRMEILHRFAIDSWKEFFGEVFMTGIGIGNFLNLNTLSETTLHKAGFS